ncbi:MAG: FeoB-associated Cys-rich membrane protein [Myxococcales bacterium]|nr:FeoB-associated Cys-rich membrane protein [Myxococcales bacterium]
MSLENLITLLICLAATAYVGNAIRKSIKKVLAPNGAGACGGCSGCGTPTGHAESVESCDLVTLKRSTPV